MSFCTKKGATSLSVDRNNESETTKFANNSLTLTQEARNSLISSLSLTISDVDQPSLSLQSDAMKKKNVSLGATACDRDVSFNANYNDRRKYDVDVAVDAVYGEDINAVTVCLARDGLMDNKLLVGGSVGLDAKEKSYSYSVGVEYKHSDDIVVGVKSNDNLQGFDVGFMYDKVGGYRKYALFGQASLPSYEYRVGVQRQINAQSSVGIVCKRWDRTANVRYNFDQSNFSGFVGANLNFDDSQNRVNLQYGVSFSY